MTGDVFNLFAAILCTIGSGVGAAALFLSDPTFVNHLAAWGAVVATIGGLMWIGAAIVALNERRGRRQ
jgi:hypothetical protein